jgi:cytochrome c5
MLKGMRMFGNKSKSRTLVAILVVASMSACTKDAALEPVVVTPTDGKKLYDEYCSSCHEGQIPKAPHRDWLAKMAPDAVVRALTVGSMQRAALNAWERPLNLT